MAETQKNYLPLIQRKTMPVHHVPQGVLQEELNRLDETAAHRVEHDEPAPGPFGSATMLYNVATEEHFIVDDRHDSNRVNRDGPHAHAEAVSLYPEYFSVTTEALEKLSDNANWVLVFLSTGQSCPSCFTKQHVAVNAWRNAGLIQPGQVLNFYGADYDMTKSVAGFSDKDQLEDMVNNPMGGPLSHAQANFVGSSILDINPQAQQVFRESDKPAAVIMRDGVIIGKGYDTRAESGDLMATAEMNAVKAAVEWQKIMTVKNPEHVIGSEMISATPLFEAPLARTAMFWAKIGVGIYLRNDYMDASHHQTLQTVEAEGVTNAELYKAGTYQTQGRSDTLIHALQAERSGVDGFQNIAQKAWNPRLARDAARGVDSNYDGGTGSKSGHAPGCC
ncbi:MAG: hypothetical protein AAF988_05925 [Pseudomonadota bacterium]